MKALRSCTDLAVLGAAPLFAEPLFVGRPNIGSKEKMLSYLEQILERRWLTNYGVLVQEFERRLAQYLGVKHAIPICNGTVALELAIRALGLTGEVIVPSFTFVATAHALQWQGIRPVFVDVDPKTHNLDPKAVEAAITPKTTGILGVHLWGRPCDTEALADIARRHRLRLLYDAAHAFACSHAGTMIGGFGDCEIFSFHATKFFNTSEGGAICTNDDELAAKLRLMKNFGFQGYDNVVYVGTNGKMPEICAAMGLTNLDYVEDFIAMNHRNQRAYAEGLAGIDGLQLAPMPVGAKSNHQYVVVEIDAERFGMSRDLAYKALHAEQVIARRYFYPGCHRMEPYRSMDPEAGRRLPHTEALGTRVLCFPTGSQTSPDQIAQICAILRFLHANAAEVRQRVTA